MALTAATARSADVEITMVGMREFEAQLKRLGTAASKKARVAALTAGAKIVQADAARRAVRSARPRKIGHLADSIIVKTTINKAGETQVLVGPDAKHWYGAFVEHVTRGMPARPFLRPALDENQQAVQDAIREELRAEIKRLTGV